MHGPLKVSFPENEPAARIGNPLISNTILCYITCSVSHIMLFSCIMLSFTLYRLFLWAHFMEVCVKNCQPSCNFSSGLWASCLDACKWRCLKARMLARQRLCKSVRTGSYGPMQEYVNVFRPSSTPAPFALTVVERSAVTERLQAPHSFLPHRCFHPPISFFQTAFV